MKVIEPCCYHKQIEELIDRCAENHESANFFSFSDWDLCDLLDTLSGYCCGGEMNIALVRIDTKTITAISRILTRTSIRKDDPSHQSFGVSKMILVTQPPVSGSLFDQRKEIEAQLGRHIKSGQLVVCEDNIGFRCVALRNPERKHNIVIQGSLNTQRNGVMQMFTLTGSPTEYDNVADMFRIKEHTKNIFKNSFSDKRT